VRVEVPSLLTPNKYIEKNSTLVEQCKLGNHKAQYDLYKLYSKAMLNTCMRFIKQEEEAEDVLQEASVDAFTKIGSFKMEASFGLWLKQIVVNKSINHLRSKKLDLVDIEEHTRHIEAKSEPEYDDSEAEYKIEKINAAFTTRVSRGVEYVSL
jgi:RNA polymerase sigma factor (sigma-70 family)